MLYFNRDQVLLKKMVAILESVTGKDVRIRQISADEYAELPFKEIQGGILVPWGKSAERL
jgi:hypothetical protein